MFNIRRTSRELGLRSDASTRFEKGQDPNLTLAAVEQAVALVTEIAGGEVASEIQDSYPKPVQPQIIEFELNTVKRLLGVDLAKQDVIDILESLGMHIVEPEKSLSSITVEIPTYRNDISIKEDLIEELGRIYGYDRFIPTLPKRDLAPAPTNPQRDFIRKLKKNMAALGMSEVYTYSFVGEDLYNNALMDIAECLRLINPVSPELQFVRNSLIPSLLDKVKINIPNFNKFGLFEISKTVNKKKLDQEKLPLQQYELACMYIGKDYNQTQTYRQVKNIIDNLVREIHVPIGLTHIEKLKQNQYPSYLHPGRSGVISTEDGTSLGYIGLLHPSVLKNSSIKYPVGVLTLNVDDLITEHSKHTEQYSSIPTYQNVTRDISIMVGSKVEVQSFVEAITDQADTKIQSVEIFDIYYDTKTRNKKSVSLHLSISAQEGNLTDEQIDEVVEKTIRLLSKKFKATLRK
jgi:phenylalanyl-tRNA synthetase beta chain